MGAWHAAPGERLLLIPLRTAAGKLASVQAIFSEKRGDRDKDFLKGGAKTGAFFVLGDPAHADVIYIAEGLATAASVLDAADGEESWCAIMACDAGNMRPVAEAVHALYPGKRIVIAADNDRATQGNPDSPKRPPPPRRSRRTWRFLSSRRARPDLTSTTWRPCAGSRRFARRC